MLKYIVWSKHKVLSYSKTNKSDYSTNYQHLLATESENGSLSSVVEVNDEAQFHQFHEAAYNETDVDLCYIQVLRFS